MVVRSPGDRTRQPLIPFDILDAPTQRLYISAVVIALNAWRLFDWLKLVQDESESVWLFLKWTAIDGVTIFNVPVLRIPWLQWSFVMSTILFLLASTFNGLLMFRVAIPLEIILISLSKLLFDKEIAVSERRVKAYNILHNSSLILGKQIINILPEGSAIMNPEKQSFCLGYNTHSVDLPIRINQTNPILLELLRIDLDGHQNNTITVNAKELKKLRNAAIKAVAKHDASSPLTLKYPVKKTGLYRLRRTLDETNLEVRYKNFDTYVTSCPKAKFLSSATEKCFGELSDLKIEVEGIPPLKLKYSRVINGKDNGFSLQTIHPEDQTSQDTSSDEQSAVEVLVKSGLKFAQSQRVQVPLNETLSIHGDWLYSIDEVHDAHGNIANLTILDEERSSSKSRSSDWNKHLLIRERPEVALSGLGSQSPLKLPLGRSSQLPLKFVHQDGRHEEKTYSLSYRFTAVSDLEKEGEHSNNPLVETVSLKNPRDFPTIKEPGLYSLESLSSPYCPGKVVEPSTFMLINPPEPKLSVGSQPIHDNCAGNSIGLMANFDLIGTPPFTIRYDVLRSGHGSLRSYHTQANHLKHQLELKPQEAGHYVYTFRTIDDDVYKGHKLSGSQYVLEQDVKPLASARFLDLNHRKTACIGESTALNVQLQGEGPWSLEYEVVQAGKRKKYKSENIEHSIHSLHLEPFIEGGEHTVSLATVQDRSGCKVFLQEDAKMEVRRQRPRGSFTELDGTMSVLTTQTKGKRIHLPLKLTGEPPWTVKYQRIGDAHVQKSMLWKENDAVDVDSDGVYKLLSVDDASCPGLVDSEKTFEVAWIARPQIELAESAFITKSGSRSIKKDVCMGDEDSFEINLRGTPPYTVKYRQMLRPVHGSKSTSTKSLTAGLGKASIRMETAKAGLYEYEFLELGDYLYDHDSRMHRPLVLEQRVQINPSARFSKPGKTHKYCKEVISGDEVIAIALEGKAPFQLELAVKQHSSNRPEIIHIPNIESNSYNFQIPDRFLALGNHVVSLRKVRDSNGCQNKIENEAAKIHVTVSDVPSIVPTDARTDYCVGDRIGFSLSGTPPFSVYYSFNGVNSRASSTSTVFKRLAETPGNFTIDAISDSGSDCKASTSISKYIHQLPNVKISGGLISTVDIHEGAEADIVFEFGGTPPFEFTYTRSSNAHKGVKSEVLETKREISYEHSMVIRSSLEGTYEVIAIKDRFCGFSAQRVEGKKAQKMLEYI